MRPESCPALVLNADFRPLSYFPLSLLSWQETVKAVSAQYTAEELITKRAQVRDDIKALMSDRLKESNIILDDFNILEFSFSPEFNRAIEAKHSRFSNVNFMCQRTSAKKGR